MPHYTLQQYCEIVILYGECQRNARAAARLFAERYPNAAVPTHNAILSSVRRLCTTGTITPRKHLGRPMTMHTTDILAHVLAHPHISTRQASKDCGVSFQHINKIMQQHRCHPYHVHVQQGLHPGDEERRFVFCNALLNKLDEHPEILRHIMWTDEAKFTSNGIINLHNQHYYAITNPH